MIGPGTGIAPFRAFLQERRAIGARGRNWLFFGNPHRESDFLYHDELLDYRRDGLLTRLDTAFSRDQEHKVYVQHHMLESAAELWAWLEDGAHLYVCGDAERMARDVDRGLAYIVAKQGGMEPAAAKSYLARLASEGRYQRDVY
jgi:sulfite reductase (NADPH) flavoprotein alpha-component